MEYTADFFKNTKIRIESEEHFNYVLELGFKCNYKWCGGKDKDKIKYIDGMYLFFYDDHEITWDNEHTFFENHKYEEITIPMPEEEIKWPDDERYTVRAGNEFWGLHPELTDKYINNSDDRIVGGEIIRAFNNYAERPHQTEDTKVSVCTRDDKCNRVITDSKGNTAKVDVYDVLKAFNVTCPATQHAVTKLLCTGARGHKDKETDLKESIDAIKRAVELHKVK